MRWIIGFAFCASSLDIFGCSLQIAAAISIQEPMTQIIEAFSTVEPNCKVFINADGSHKLARQISAGADVDVFVAADQEVLAMLNRKPIAVRPLLYNSLKLISPHRHQELKQFFEKANAIAIGHPELPAGRYAFRYLAASGYKALVQPKLVQADNVRAVLAMIDRKIVDGGFVYATDLRHAANKMQSEFSLPGVEAVYPAALMSKTASARRFFEFLSGRQANAVFVAAGFATKPSHG